MHTQVVKKGVQAIAQPKILSDIHGSVKVAIIRTYGDTMLLCKGTFLPEYNGMDDADPTAAFFH